MTVAIKRPFEPVGVLRWRQKQREKVDGMALLKRVSRHFGAFFLALSFSDHSYWPSAPKRDSGPDDCGRALRYEGGRI